MDNNFASFVAQIEAKLTPEERNELEAWRDYFRHLEDDDNDDESKVPA